MTISLESNLDLTSILSEVDTLLPQLSNFVVQFNNLVIETGINVVTDSSGNMSIDVPNTMASVDASNVSKKIGIIDRLISNHTSNIDSLLKKGLSIEDKLKMDNPNYNSQLMDKVNELKRLKSSYKH